MSFRMSNPDIDLVSALESTCAKQASLAFEVEDFGEEIEVDREELLKAIDTILATIKKHPDLMPASYVLTYTIPELGITFTDATNASNVRLNGDTTYIYGIHSGVGYCDLEKWGVGPDGRGVKVETNDIRHLDHLVTDNMGEIRINSKRRKSTLSRNLKDLRKFLKKSNDQNVRKMLC